MATLQDVQNAIDTYEQAEADATAAQAQLVTVEAAVQIAVAAEQATFDAAQALFSSQLQLARDAAGFGAAFSAYQAASEQVTTTSVALKAIMAEYAAG